MLIKNDVRGNGKECPHISFHKTIALIDSCNTCLVSACYVPGIVPGLGKILELVEFQLK